MSEPAGDPWPRIVRAAIPGRPRVPSPPAAPDTSTTLVWQPGRASLEWSILCSAVGLLFPLLALVGAGFAIRARRQGSPRWLAALLAALWCLVLGGSVRLALGFGFIP